MRVVLSPLGWIYDTAGNFRRKLYQTGALKSIRLSKPVISVGNLTLGGTGKTPFVDYLLGAFEQQGLKTCVLTRGYGRQSQDTLIVDSSLGLDQVGDEPFWLFSRHPNAKILVSQHRARAATAVSDVDLFLLDDGFQHHLLKKDLEIVLLDATRPQWHYKPVPQGYARESWRGLKRADLVVLTKTNMVSQENLQNLKNQLKFSIDVEVIESQLLIDKTEDFSGNNIQFSGKEVFCISGIGNPQSFETLINQSGGKVLAHRKFADHHSYSPSEIDHLLAEFKNSGAPLLLMTEKDGVKWKNAIPSNRVEIGIVKTKLEFHPHLPSIYDLALHNFY